MRQFIEHSDKISINRINKYLRQIKGQKHIEIEIEGQGQIIYLTKTKCNYGNCRNWFICPSCKRKVGILYKPPLSNNYLCNKCHNLTYWDRFWHKR